MKDGMISSSCIPTPMKKTKQGNSRKYLKREKKLQMMCRELYLEEICLLLQQATWRWSAPQVTKADRPRARLPTLLVTANTLGLPQNLKCLLSAYSAPSRESPRVARSHGRAGTYRAAGLSEPCGASTPSRWGTKFPGCIRHLGKRKNMKKPSLAATSKAAAIHMAQVYSNL